MRRSDFTFPLQRVKVSVGLGGLHYHLPECPCCHPESFSALSPKLKPVDNDYLTIEVPKELIDEEAPIDYLGHYYRSHLKACKELIAREEGKKSNAKRSGSKQHRTKESGNTRTRI